MALVQSKAAHSAGNASFTVTLTSAATAGNLIEVTTGWCYAGTVGLTIAVSDDKGNSYVKACEAGTESTFVPKCQKWYAKNITGGATVITITPSGGSVNTNIGAVVDEYSGLDKTAPLDKTAVAGATFSTSPDSGSSGTLTQASEVVTCGVSTQHNGNTITVGTGFTQTSQTDGAVGSEYQTVASTAALDGTWTIGSADYWTCALATYKVAAAAGGNLFRPASLSGVNTGGPFFGNPLACARHEIGKWARAVRHLARRVEPCSLAA